MSHPGEQAERASLEQETEQVIAYFQERVQSRVGGTFSQLIYLAFLRDPNTGRYSHYELDTRFSPGAVDEGLRRCHSAVFEQVVGLPLKEQTRGLISFFRTKQEDPKRLVGTWERLRTYQMLLPEHCPPLARELFSKNMELALKVARETELWPLIDDSHRDADDLT
jgi:hypothetical protein